MRNVYNNLAILFEWKFLPYWVSSHASGIFRSSTDDDTVESIWPKTYIFTLMHYWQRKKDRRVCIAAQLFLSEPATSFLDVLVGEEIYMIDSI
jgi:hypothetical protein